MRRGKAQDAIIRALEAAGATVWPSVDGHPPHLLVSFRGQLYGGNIPTHSAQDSGGWPTWSSPEDALRAIDARLSDSTTPK
jgi:hypothetical protein